MRNLLDQPVKRRESLADASIAISAERNDVRQVAYKRARDSRALKVNTEQLNSVKESALAVARGHNLEPYDPTKNSDDRGREDRFEADNVEAELLGQALAHARAKVRDIRELVAKADPGPAPRISPLLWVFVVSAVLALVVTIVPTVRDFLL